MPESFYFPVYTGLLTPEHRERIGPAIWEFLWLISKVTKEVQEEGETLGIVLGGRPVKLAEIADDLGSSERSVRRNITRLKEQGYIESVRAPYGEIYRVRKSKKFAYHNRPAKNGLSANERVATSDLSGDERVAKNGRSESREWPLLSQRSATSGLSNKDIKDIKNITDRKIDDDDIGNDHAQSFQLIANRYIQRRGKGLSLSPKDETAIEKLLQEQIPLDDILKLIDQVFDEYEPKFNGDEIHSFEYVRKVLLSKYHGQKGEDTDGGTIRKHRRGISRPSAEGGKTYEQILQEAEAARRAWGWKG
ncbi:putative transcriptional regulator [Geobacillus phage vB_GthS_PK5.2]|nr:putative transcriptional regulator [Geobacillus phage vB_GthS_PK5.2]